MSVFGTAGHVDHGKTTLLKVLTGIDPDRLKEEKEREMTTDLGFAWLTKLPSGREIGFIDVPGHEKFLKNMLAGIGSIKAVLFVVAADEGWMPQSEEHLKIVDSLDINHGIIVLTKIDLVDASVLSKRIEFIKEKIKNTSLSNAPVFPVSSTSGKGVNELINEIDRLLSVLPESIDLERPRLFIDRVFTIKGSGTVVAGTLQKGKLYIGQAMQLMPYKKEVRVRGLQTHKHTLNEAQPGTRVAVNISNAEVNEVQRGDCLILAGQQKLTDRILVKVKIVSPDQKIKNNKEIAFYMNSFETNANIKKSIGIGENQFFMDLKLAKPTVVDVYDHFVIRDFGQNITLGGGIVLSSFVKEKKYNIADKVSVLQRRADAGIFDILGILLDEEKVLNKNFITVEIPLGYKFIADKIDELSQKGEVEVLKSFVIEKKYFNGLVSKIAQLLSEFHSKNPLLYGIAIEEIRKKISLNKDVMTEIIDTLLKTKKIELNKTMIKLPSHNISFKDEHSAGKDKILNLLKNASFSPPTIKELAEVHHCSMDILHALINSGEVIRIDSDFAYHKDAVESVKNKVIDFIKQKKELDVNSFKNILNVSRKYAIPLLEYLDKTGVTVRKGNIRVLKQQS